MRTVRLAVAAAGLALALVGVRALFVLGWDNFRATVVWLAVGVAAHDAVLAPITVGLGLLTVRLLPAFAKAPLVVAFVVFGSLTVLAVPVLGRFGARPDNPTLLDRDYGTAWWGLAIVVLLAVVVASLVERRRTNGKG